MWSWNLKLIQSTTENYGVSERYIIAKLWLLQNKVDKCKSTARDRIIFTFNAFNQVESSTSFVSTQYSRMEFAHTTNLPPFEQFFVTIKWHEMR